MGNKKKPVAWVLFGLYVLWTLVIQPVWNLNIERVAEQNKVDGALAGFAPVTWLREIAEYLPSSFAAGFVVGGLLFAYWDTILTWVKRRILRKSEVGGAELDQADDPMPSLWAGRIEPHFADMMSKGRFSVIVSIVNLGAEDFVFRHVEGKINACLPRGKFELDSLVISQDPTSQGMGPGHYANIVFYQYVSTKVAYSIHEDCESTNGVVLDFRNVRLVFSPKSDSDAFVRVGIREGVRLRRGYDYIGSVEVMFPD